MKRSSLLLFIVLMCGGSMAQALTLPAADSIKMAGIQVNGPVTADLLLAEGDTQNPQQQEQPLPGTLILPNAEPEKPDSEKKCMTVCARWGEECMLLNRGAGGMERKCRRTCKQFAEQCF